MYEYSEDEILQHSLHSIDCRVKRWWGDCDTKSEILYMLEETHLNHGFINDNGCVNHYPLEELKYSGVKLFLGVSCRCKNIFHLHGAKKENINTISLKFPSNGLDLSALPTVKKKFTWHGPYIMNYVKLNPQTIPAVAKLFRKIAETFHGKVKKFHTFVNKAEGRLDFVTHLNAKQFQRIEITFEPIHECDYCGDYFW